MRNINLNSNALQVRNINIVININININTNALQVRKSSTTFFILSQDQRGSSIKATTTFIAATLPPIKRSNTIGWTAATSAGEEKKTNSVISHQSGNTVWTWFPSRPSRKMTTFKTGLTHETLRILGRLEGKFQ